MLGKTIGGQWTDGWTMPGFGFPHLFGSRRLNAGSPGKSVDERMALPSVG